MHMPGDLADQRHILLRKSFGIWPGLAPISQVGDLKLCALHDGGLTQKP